MVEGVQGELAARANPEHAAAMAAYMKTTMPFYGVKRPGWRPIERALKREWAPADRGAYEAAVLALWGLPHREEKYLAIAYAQTFTAFVVPASMPLFERLVREGAWWDLVDGVASHLVGGAYAADRGAVRPSLDRWIEDPDMWIRRTAIICQLRHKAATDEAQLFDYCLRRAHEREFFIRKAIGWALRQYAKTAPEAVLGFLARHREALSGLSYREAARPLIKAGLLAG